MSSETLHSTSRLDSIKNLSTISSQNNLFQLNNTNFTPLNIISSLNLLRTIRNQSTNTGSVSSLSPALSTNANDLNTQRIAHTECKTLTTNPLVSNLKNELQKNETLKIGDYILFESNNNNAANLNDSFNTAFNLKIKKFFYWKKFEKENYLQKLKAFFIMENSKLIYNFKEIILEENSNENTTSNVYIIYEPHFGDLHAYMKAKKRLDEQEAKKVFGQCAEAVSDCHANGIIVRDIKLKKFVFVNAERTKIALANLEDCLILEDNAPNDLIKSQQGCPAYVSPEVLKSYDTGYSGRLSDSWSLGIILFTLLIGRYPFHHQNMLVMFIKIACGNFQIPSSIELSVEVKNLMKSLIRIKPTERLLPNQILEHKWMKNGEKRECESIMHQQAPNKTRNFSDESDSSNEEPAAKKIKSNQLSNTEDDRAVPSFSQFRS